MINRTSRRQQRRTAEAVSEAARDSDPRTEEELRAAVKEKLARFAAQFADHPAYRA